MNCSSDTIANTYLELKSIRDSWLFLKNSLFLFTVFLSGYTAFGIPLICVALIYLGMSDALFVSYFSINFGLKGYFLIIPISILYITPILFCFLYVSFSSLRLTLITFNTFKPKSRFIQPSTYSYPHFCRFLFYLFLLFICSLLYYFVFIPILNVIL